MQRVQEATQNGAVKIRSNPDMKRFMVVRERARTIDTSAAYTGSKIPMHDQMFTASNS